MPAIDEKKCLVTLSGHRLSTTDSSAAFTATIEIHSQPDIVLDDAPLAKKDLDETELGPLLGKNWTLEIIAKGGTPSAPSPNLLQFQITQNLDPGTVIWIRLKLTASAKSAAWSFDTPQPNSGDNPGSHHTTLPPVLLIANDIGGEKTWDGQFTDPANFDCVLSRTTWLDWERWFNNPALSLNGQATSSLFSQAARAFVEASIMRGEDASGRLSNQLDRLPDPAVDKFVIELAHIDKLSESSPYLATQAMVVDAPLWLRGSGDIPQVQGGDYAQYFDDLCGLLDTVDRRFRLKVAVSGGDFSLGTTTITVEGENYTCANVKVPAGTVAVLSVRPLVRKQLFDAQANDPSKPLFGKLMQLARGSRKVGADDYLVFPGAELTLEGMLDAEYNRDDYAAILKECIQFQCPADSRGYRVLQALSSAAPAIGRCFSHVDVRTQRWRFSGRPIYGWISPRGVRKDKQSNVAMELDERANGGELLPFERSSSSNATTWTAR